MYTGVKAEDSSKPETEREKEAKVQCDDPAALRQELREKRKQAEKRALKKGVAPMAHELAELERAKAEINKEFMLSVKRVPINV